MSPMSTDDEGPQHTTRLSAPTHGCIVIAGIMVLVCACTIGYTLHDRREKCESTRDRLRQMALLLMEFPEAFNTPPSGKRWWIVSVAGPEHLGVALCIPGQPGRCFEDDWGHPFVFCRPGPVHSHGWDLWSYGPNGRDDDAQGDDLAIGVNDRAN